jgi:hypothetical protein
MTPEELQAELETVKAHNAKLLGELKVAKAKAKGAEIDPEEHARLQTEVETLTGKLTTAEKSGKTEIEKLKLALTEKDGALQSYLIEGGLSDALAKAGVKPEFMDAAKALLKSQAAIKAEDGKYQALIGDKPLAEAVKGWATEGGKHFIAATQNSGGGATGGGQNGNTKKFADMTSEERVSLYRTDPKAYEAAKTAG